MTLRRRHNLAAYYVISGGSFFNADDEQRRGGADVAFERAYLRAMQDARIARQLGTPRARQHRALAGNGYINRQSVVKRIKGGGCRTARQLGRQIAYITREGDVDAWGNVAGIGADEVRGEDLPEIIESWTAGWRGAPGHGHTDHILLSFPKDADPELAKEIAAEWGERLFGGEFGETWRYVAAFHTDREHPHAHFVVDKRGVDNGEWLSIGRYGQFDYQDMRELHAAIAHEHGMEIHASSRLSRGLTDPRPSDLERRRAMREGRAVEEGFKGKLMEHGAAPYMHDPENSDSYFVKLALPSGERTIWGVELGTAVHESGAAIGETVHLLHDGKEAVTVTDRKGNELTVERNSWKMTVPGRDAVQMVRLSAMAESYSDMAETARMVAEELPDREAEADLVELSERMARAADSIMKGEAVMAQEDASPQAALNWIETHAAMLAERLQETYEVISELPESAEKTELQGQFARTVQDAEAVLYDAPALKPYLTPTDNDLYAVPELAAMQEMARLDNAAELSESMARRLEETAEALHDRLDDGTADVSGIVSHFTAGQALSQGELNDWLREDTAAYLAAHGESLETANDQLVRDAGAWLVDRVDIANEHLAAHPELIPTEAYGWLAYQHDPDYHDGRTLADINERYAARLDAVPDDELGRIARGDPDAMGSEFVIEDSRRAFAADAIERNHDRLVELGHNPEAIEAELRSLRNVPAEGERTWSDFAARAVEHHKDHNMSGDAQSALADRDPDFAAALDRFADEDVARLARGDLAPVQAITDDALEQNVLAAEILHRRKAGSAGADGAGEGGADTAEARYRDNASRQQRVQEALERHRGTVAPDDDRDHEL